MVTRVAACIWACFRRHSVGFGGFASVVTLGMLNSQAGGALIEEFKFNDPAGTAITAVTNSAGSGHMWADDLQGDLAGVTTNGLGQYNASAKSNLATGDAFLPIDPDILTGTVYGVIEMTWNFQVSSFDPAEPEEVRLSLLNLNTVGTSTVTAEVQVGRSTAGDPSILGTAVGTGSANIPAVSLGGVAQTSTFIAIIGANLDANFYSIFYSKDAGATFATLTGGLLDPARGLLQVRLRLNNDLSQDSVLIDRVAIYDNNPFPDKIPGVPEPAGVALAGLSMCGLLCLGIRSRKR